MLVFHGTLAHSTEQNALEILEDACIGIKDSKIVFVEPFCSLEKVRDRHGLHRDEIRLLGKGQLLIPGFIDTHIHAPQYPNLGLGLDLPLLQWLEKYTFPLEQRYSDVEFAKFAYEQAVKRVLMNGTTTASYFATIHLEASLQLTKIVERLGQRAHIGKVNMDRNCPDTYRETTEASLKETEQFVRTLVEKQNSLLTPVITPRFPPSTSSSLLHGLSCLAKDYNIPVQSHISENRVECKWVKELFPEQASYADVFRKYGLLSNKTVLAHGVYLDDAELNMLHQSGTAISHCPNSNISIRSGLFDTQNALAKGIKVGLGTDVSGGYSPSILDAQRQAVLTSKIISMHQGVTYTPLNYQDAFHLATLGGATALGLSDTVGNFVVGKQFDAIVVDTICPDYPFDIYPEDDSSALLQRFLHQGDDRNMTEIYVAGKCVIDKTRRKAV